MAEILVDTSALYALFDRDDANHSAARSRLRSLKKSRTEPLLTNFLLAECHALLLGRLGHDFARRFLRDTIWRIERLTEADEHRARDIIIAHADKSFSYVDATTFAVMERRGLTRVFAFDRHFVQYGFTLL